MLIKHPDQLPSSEITPKDVFMNRRRFLVAGGVAGVSLAAGDYLLGGGRGSVAEAGQKPAGVSKSQYVLDEKQNTLKEFSTYNNFYEFGTGKDEPSENAGSLKTRPWSVRIEGEV